MNVPYEYTAAGKADEARSRFLDAAQAEADRRNAAALAAHRARVLAHPLALADMLRDRDELADRREFGLALQAALRGDVTHLQLLTELALREDAAATVPTFDADAILDEAAAEEAARDWSEA